MNQVKNSISLHVTVSLPRPNTPPYFKGTFEYIKSSSVEKGDFNDLNNKVIELRLGDKIDVRWNIRDDDQEDTDKTVAIENTITPLDTYAYLYQQR